MVSWMLRKSVPVPGLTVFVIVFFCLSLHRVYYKNNCKNSQVIPKILMKQTELSNSARTVVRFSSRWYNILYYLLILLKATKLTLYKRIEENDQMRRKPDLHIHFFNEFSISSPYYEYAPSSHNSTQLTLLISYLVANQDTKVPKDVLMSMLWPDVKDKVPVGALRNLVYRARKELERWSITQREVIYSTNPRNTTGSHVSAGTGCRWTARGTRFKRVLILYWLLKISVLEWFAGIVWLEAVGNVCDFPDASLLPDGWTDWGWDSAWCNQLYLGTGSCGDCIDSSWDDLPGKANPVVSLYPFQTT